MVEKFKSVLNQDYLVDKSNIINDFNKLINKDGNCYICITKPRRFGKTSIAAMLVTYYSKRIDSKEIFDNLKVAKGKSSNIKVNKNEIEQYKEFQGKYHTLYFDFSYDVDTFNTLDEYLASINKNFKKDIRKLYPNSIILNGNENKIYNNLKDFYSETKEKFIIIIDEWDYIISSSNFTPEEKEQEVRNLCGEDEKYYKELERWYNGYKAYNGEKIFNSWSVYQALSENVVDNYWTQARRFDELVNVINFIINRVTDEIIELIKGKKIKIKLEKYGAENLQKQLEKKEKKSNKEMKKKLYSKMVTFGFLTYYNNKIFITNKELREKFAEVFNNRKIVHKYFNDMMEISDKMLKMTLEKNQKAICEILDEIHMKKITAGDKIDHGNLKRIIDFAYFYSHSKYEIKEEEAKGKGIVDFIFYPKGVNRINGEIIILELKVNGSAKQAIDQIKKKKYFFGLKEKGYKGNILLIGINYNQKSTKYSCIIEEYDSNLNRLSSTETENKRKNETESDGIFKRLRSRHLKSNEN